MRLYLWRRTETSNWIIRGTDAEGREVNQSTKTTNKAAAEGIRIKKEAELLHEVVHGKKAVVTFDQAAESYLDNGGSPRFLGTFDEETGKWSGLMSHLMGVPLKDITQARMNEIGKALYPNVRPDTLNRQLWTPFIAIWSHAERMEWAQPKRWIRPKKPKGTNVESFGPKRVGSYPVPYGVAWEFIKGLGVANATVFTILFYSGMRPIELFTMDTSQVNVKNRWITLAKSKIGEPRGVPIHEALVPMLTDMVENRPGRLVRTWDNEHFTVVENAGGQMKKAIIAARLRTHIFDVAPYTARHTVSTQLVIEGVHPHTKDQILGHSADDMSRHYTHVPQAPLIEAINKLPTIQEWLDQDWMREPVKHAHRWAKPLKKAEREAGERAFEAWQKRRAA
ncbi:putative prophage integrase [Bradyrhizobium sp. ORS 375]|uniref:tyrosine-type recombinase/integrase n=1 Tax=Bradyrhizobium sp. (strain ORS 375) TaxID=566679 RepID=UPI00024063F9|nr:tyrosine-type recombinase/integrase [Bradyrhizobium sp. ORS 375]CCD94618.1 putative prophage integrase [Bradyrhizobium sp. ORS 375]